MSKALTPLGERAAIVAWLRGQAAAGWYVSTNDALEIAANKIEAGEHEGAADSQGGGGPPHHGHGAVGGPEIAEAVAQRRPPGATAAPTARCESCGGSIEAVGDLDARQFCMYCRAAERGCAPTEAQGVWCTRCGNGIAASAATVETVDGKRHDRCPEAQGGARCTHREWRNGRCRDCGADMLAKAAPRRPPGEPR